jgi:hypothetical protein
MRAKDAGVVAAWQAWVVPCAFPHPKAAPVDRHP